MKLLITGAKGFIGKNLTAALNNVKNGCDKNFPFLTELEIYECDLDTPLALFREYCKRCDFVIHLAGVNRPQKLSDFMAGNYGFTGVLVNTLKEFGSKAPILISSSIQATLDNEYGKSKKAAEDYIIDYGKISGIETYVFRLPNVYGKWCKPNYNSVVATFCYNIANDLPITINNRETELTFVYIDDVVAGFINAINGDVVYEDGYCKIPVEDKATLGFLADSLYSFRDSRKNLNLPDMSNSFLKKLYATYISYLPEDGFGYSLVSHRDERGSFTEFIHTKNNGQVSVNVSKPHVIKGQHWHNTKNEKFLVVSGKGVIRFRKIGTDEVIEYEVSGEKSEVIDIPVGYTHNIENTGDTDMVTIMWCSEIFDSEKPDTYYQEV